MTIVIRKCSILAFLRWTDVPLDCTYPSKDTHLVQNTPSPPARVCPLSRRPSCVCSVFLGGPSFVLTIVVVAVTVLVSVSVAAVCDTEQQTTTYIPQSDIHSFTPRPPLHSNKSPPRTGDGF